MPSLEEMRELKKQGCPCLALLCAECQCNMCNPPFLMVHAKLGCCTLNISDGKCCNGCDCISCESTECWSADHGCAEVIAKMCCVYLEVQFPPGCDIGVGFCGCRCCGGPTDARERGYLKVEDAPEQQAM